MDYFLPCPLGVGFHCIFGVPSCVKNMSPRCVGMVCRLLMTSGFVMFGGFPVVAGGMSKMFRCLLVRSSCFLRHRISSTVFASTFAKKYTRHSVKAVPN